MTFTSEWSTASGDGDDLRRYRVLQVTADLLAAMFGKGTGESVAVEEVPDLRIIAVRFDYWRNCVEFLCQSDSFEPVDPASPVSYWNPSFRRISAEVA